MLRSIKTLLLATIIIIGVWALLNRDKLQSPADLVSLVRQQWKSVQPTLSPGSSPDQSHSASNRQQPGFKSQPPRTRIDQALATGPVIRIASFKLNGFATTIANTQRLPMLTDICRRYDAIALQGIDGHDDVWLNLLADSLNATGQSADYFFISDLENAGSSGTQSAVLFNRATLDLDDLTWYTVNDPDDLLRREPLVGWFRTRTQDPNEAFTFTLANIELNSVRPDLELAYLAELYRAIRDDGRGEDDVIIVGDFNAGDRGLEPIHERAGLTWVISNTPTDIRNTAQYDNLVFNERATIEFTGRGGVFDFMRKYNLRLDEAEALSKRMPVWAEFLIREGTGRRRVASEEAGPRF